MKNEKLMEIQDVNKFSGALHEKTVRTTSESLNWISFVLTVPLEPAHGAVDIRRHIKWK